MSSYLAHKRKGFQGAAPLAFDGFGNRSRSFNGVDDVVDLGQTTDNAIFTASAWLKLKAHDNSAGEGIFGKWQTAAGGSWLIYADAGATPNIKFIVRNGANDAFTIVDSGISASSIVGDWTHIAGVADGTNLTIYINGVSEGSIAYDGTINNPTTAIVIGAYNHTVNPTLHLTEGNIADCRLYNIALTATEISDIYNGTNITTNLVGHWLTDSDNVLDAAGTNHGTNYGTKYSYDNPSPPVEFGSASRLFDGVDDRINIASTPRKQVPLTISAWVKLDNITSVGGIVSIEGNVTASTNTGFGLVQVNGEVWAFAQESSTFDKAVNSNTLAPNVWYHVCGVFRSNTDRQIYINGVGEGSNSTNITPDVNFVDNVVLGNRAQTVNDQPFDGKIADVRIYDTDLTASQISDLYSGTDVQTNLVGHYLTDNDDVEDKAGTNDGTNFGSTYSYDNPPMDLIPSRQASRSFNGTSDRVTIPASLGAIFTTGDFAISQWFKVEQGVNDFAYSIAEGGDSPSQNKGFGTGIMNGQVYGFIHDGVRLTFLRTGGVYNDGQWHHRVDNFDRDGNWSCYVDGVLDASQDISARSSTITNGHDTNIGMYISSPVNGGGYYEGKLSDVRAYESLLSVGDISDLYAGTTDRTNLIGQWLTNSDDVVDHAGTNDGTNNGSTYSNDSPS